MTFEEAVELVSSWPKNRNVPSRLKAGIASAKGIDRVLMGNLVEALVVASETEADLKLVQKYFD